MSRTITSGKKIWIVFRWNLSVSTHQLLQRNPFVSARLHFPLSSVLLIIFSSFYSHWLWAFDVNTGCVRAHETILRLTKWFALIMDIRIRDIRFHYFINRRIPDSSLGYDRWIVPDESEYDIYSRWSSQALFIRISTLTRSGHFLSAAVVSRIHTCTTTLLSEFVSEQNVGTVPTKCPSLVWVQLKWIAPRPSNTNRGFLLFFSWIIRYVVW